MVLRLTSWYCRTLHYIELFLELFKTLNKFLELHNFAWNQKWQCWMVSEEMWVISSNASGTFERRIEVYPVVATFRRYKH